MKKLNDLMLKVMLDKRFSHLRLEHYDAFLESSLNNVAKEHLLSAVHDIIRNGLLNYQRLKSRDSRVVRNLDTFSLQMRR